MLRYVFRLQRHKTEAGEEEWADYMKRSAAQVGTMAEKYDFESWVTAYRRKKYKFAGKVARQTDDRWSKLVMHWEPHGGRGRSPGRPITRWSDDLAKFAGGYWPKSALNTNLWQAAEEGFASRLCG